jgi:hypothetical protein
MPRIYVTQDWEAAKSDPVAFARLFVKNADGTPMVPFEAQQTILRGIKRRTVIDTGRQFGKTTTMGMLVAHKAVTNANWHICIIAPSLEQARIMFCRGRELLLEWHPRHLRLRQNQAVPLPSPHPQERHQGHGPRREQPAVHSRQPLPPHRLRRGCLHQGLDHQRGHRADDDRHRQGPGRGPGPRLDAVGRRPLPRVVRRRPARRPRPRPGRLPLHQLRQPPRRPQVPRERQEAVRRGLPPVAHRVHGHLPRG